MLPVFAVLGVTAAGVPVQLSTSERRARGQQRGLMVPLPLMSQRSPITISMTIGSLPRTALLRTAVLRTVHNQCRV